MEIKGSAALVTGANRGIGSAFARALLAHGAAKVYAGVRDPETVQDPAQLLPELRETLLFVVDRDDDREVSHARERSPRVAGCRATR